MDYQQRLIKNIFAGASQSSSTQPNKDYMLSHPALNVYHHNYIENGIHALSIAFPTVLGIMEETDFRRLARNYLIARPKVCFDWADYGEDFAEYMFELDALAQMPFLPELAELDWRLMHIERESDKAFDAASFNLLQAQDPYHLQFTVAPGLQFMPVIFPVLELYTLVHNEALNLDNTESNNLRAKHLQIINNLMSTAINSGEYRSIVLWRKDYKGLFEYIHGNALTASQSMLAGKDIAAVLASFEDDQVAMTSWLQAHIESKKIYAIVAKG